MCSQAVDGLKALIDALDCIGNDPPSVKLIGYVNTLNRLPFTLKSNRKHVSTYLLFVFCSDLSGYGLDGHLPDFSQMKVLETI